MTEQSTTAPAVSIPSTVPAPKTPKRAWWKKPAILVGAGAFALGAVIGGANTPAPVEVEVERIVEKPVDRIVNIPTTPAVCMTALDLSEQAFEYAAEALGYSNEALQAAGKMDVAGIEAAGGKMQTLTPKITAIAPKVNAAKAECRAAE